MKNKRRYSLLLIILIMSLTGCSLEKERPLVRVPEESDQETEFSMAYVQKGDLVYGIEEELQLDNYKEKSYGFEVKRMDATMLEDIEFDQLFVNVGDTVKAGDVLIRRRSQSLEDSIKQYEEQKERAEIDIKHLRNRSAINPDEDNSGAINRCEETIKVANGYLAELEEKKASLSIYAEEDGKVINVSDRAISGVLSSTDNLITIASGDDTYFLETKESTTLKEGDVVQAYSYIVSYDAKVEKVEKSSAGSKIYFKIINSGEEMTIERGLKVTVAEEVKKDVLHVPAKCIKENDGHYYAFVLDEHGARVAREVETDGILGEDIIIREGLSEGDEILAK